MSAATALRALAVALVLGSACGRSDVLAEDPELEAMAAAWSPEERAELRRMLEALPRDERQRTVAEIVERERGRITVESLFASYAPAADPGSGLTIQALPNAVVSLAPAESSRIASLLPAGTLRIVQAGRVGGGPSSRVVVVMQAAIDQPIEFPLRSDGPLLLVQTDRGWVTDPAPYEPSSKTIRLRPSADGARTAVDYDIGIGRSGSEPFRWPERIGAREAR